MGGRNTNSREGQGWAVEFVLLGWPVDGPTIRLDHREFAYAGKFVTADTGKAIVRDPAIPDSSDEYDREILAAASFSPDRTDDTIEWLRYVDVRADHRGEGLGARLARYAVERILDRDTDTVRIAVNNPFAFHALYKAGFGFTGAEAGLAEVILSTDSPHTAETYQAGLAIFADRDLPQEACAFLASKAGGDPPELVADPGS